MSGNNYSSKSTSWKVLETVLSHLNWAAAAQNGKFDWFEGVLHTIDDVTRSQQLSNIEISRFYN